MGQPATQTTTTTLPAQKQSAEAKGAETKAGDKDSGVATRTYLQGLQKAAGGAEEAQASEQHAAIIQAFEAGVGGYIQKYPSAVADAYHNGTLSNLNESLKNLIGYGKGNGEGENFERGCVAMQGAAMAAVAPLVSKPDSLWVTERLMVGNGMEHHAVALHRKGRDLKSGYVLDAWIAQTSAPAKAVFDYDAWCGQMKGLSLLGAPRVE
jgi:hypothetical protein